LRRKGGRRREEDRERRKERAGEQRTEEIFIILLRTAKKRNSLKKYNIKIVFLAVPSESLARAGSPPRTVKNETISRHTIGNLPPIPLDRLDRLHAAPLSSNAYQGYHLGIILLLLCLYYGSAIDDLEGLQDVRLVVVGEVQGGGQ